MKNTSEIKHSIKATRDISQITSAMRLISTSKMQKAIKKYQANAIYFNRVRSAIKDILLHSRDLHHPYLEHSPQGNPTYVVMAADKGLCGGYNHSILTFAKQQMENDEKKYIVTIGQETRAFFEKLDIPIDLEYLHIAQDPSLYNARKLANDLCDMYMRHDINEVNLVFTRYYTSMKQEPMRLKLLPVDIEDFKDVETELEYKAQLDYYPSPKEVLNVLITQYIVGIIYGALVQAYASENSQRMLAMENATKNATEMIDKLSLQLNRARQQAITSDITEIVGAMEAL
jgi:F-type H+-transporting ATPase subunit gamma